MNIAISHALKIFACVAISTSIVACTGAGTGKPPIDPPPPPPPQNEAPKVSLQALGTLRLNSQGVLLNAGQAMVKANATDADGNLDSVTLFIDGIEKGQKLRLAPFNWGSEVFNGLTAGEHTLKVVAIDTESATAEAMSSFTVTQNTLPTVSFNSPVNMSEIDYEGDVNVALAVNDADGTISSAELFLDNNSLGVKSNAPFTWPAAQHARLAKITDTGRHDLRASVVDNDGESASSQVFFTVKDKPVVEPPTNKKLREENLVGPGPFAACLIDTEQKARCWGRNFLPNQPGNANDKPRPGQCWWTREGPNFGEGNCVGRAVPPKNLGKVIALSNHHTGACAVLETPVNGSNVRCWGPSSPGANNLPKWTDAIQLSAGYEHGCILRANGEIRCFSFGQNIQPPNGLRAKFISGGYHFTCAIKSADDKVQCFGKNVKQPPANLRAKALSVGNAHACAIQLDDTVTCWGNGGGANQPNIKAKSVAAGTKASCAVTLAGQARCWGPNVTAPAGNDFVSTFINSNANDNGTVLFIKTDRSIVQTRIYNNNKKQLLIEKNLRVIKP